MTILITLIAYFAVLMLFSRMTTRRADNDAFYRGNRQSPWWMVAFGMVGASISGVTFVSVPGMVVRQDMTYLQTCLGFILGYIAVAFVLLPVYYRMGLTTIYSYLHRRLGNRSYLTGAWFFLLSKMTGAAVRFYVVCLILHRFVVQPLLGDGAAQSGAASWGSFALTVVLMVLLIWLYTRRGGIRTLVWTDTLQTTCMLTALLLIIVKAVGMLGMSLPEAVSAIAADSHSRVFVWHDWLSPHNFWKQFLSGIFIVVVMTGLDQDMMQKNLTCKSLREAQKDMCTYGFAFVPVNLLFMALGVLLLMLAQTDGPWMQAAGLQPLSAEGVASLRGDDLLPLFAASGAMGTWAVVLFTLGIVAASFSSADSALTALTTSYCVDIARRPADERLRRRVHIAMAGVFVAIILMVNALNSTSVIDAIYILCSYTYGPLLGLFAFGLATRRAVNDRLVPFIAVASPLLCYLLSLASDRLWGYHFGYELLMLNGLLTFAGLWFTARFKKNPS